VKLRKIISGGQTGADVTGLLCARALGLETGGTAPKGYGTEGGPNLELEVFGLVESATRDNVKNSDHTLWFGNTGSPGYWCTYKAAEFYNKTFTSNPTKERMLQIAETFEVINVAGNRASKNPDVVGLVREAFDWLTELLPSGKILDGR